MAVVNINSIRNFSFRNAYEKTGRRVSRFMLDLSGSREKLPTVSKEKNINAHIYDNIVQKTEDGILRHDSIQLSKNIYELLLELVDTIEY